jgi:hypothetical protein
MAATGRDVSIRFDDNLHDLSLQGPLAVDYLEKHIPGVRQLPYMGHMPAMLFGKPITLSRTGYTGERGYEIFCRGQDAGEDLGPYPGRRQGHGDHPLPLHHAGYAADRELPSVLPLRQLGNVSVRE